ncbi:unnamed protein product [marine sediment metagenome]|uniref:Uncharacterized protein n=1 Tax=marine sediment metagenome TaxID=412755 RepID=X0YCB1_9ZZZZ
MHAESSTGCACTGSKACATFVRKTFPTDTALTYNNFSIGAGARETLSGPTLRLSLVKGACVEAKDVHNESESDRYMLVGEVK